MPRRLTPIFRDRDELPSTASLSDAVNGALENSEQMILICSPAAAASRWVNEEIRTFRRLGKAHRILCLIVDGVPGSGDETDCFPEALTEFDDGTGVAREPVAADARPQGDGRKNAFLKLVAGMLGVGFDALKQRDLRRRHQRMVIATAALALIAAVTISLAITATIARQDAEYRQTQAEDLVDYMLGDLMERLREIGRLDIYLSVGDEALDYFALQRDVDVSDRTLAQRATNLRQIGEVRMDQGDLGAALVAFNESLFITTRLAERDTDNADAQIGQANSHFFVGNVHWQRGELAAARREFERVLPIVNRLAEREPGNTEWLMEQGFAYTNLGRVLELEGVLEDALEAYQNVMLVNQQLVELEPDNEDWDLEVGYAHNNIGKLVIALGRLDEAESNYRRDLEIKTQVFAESPEHNARRAYLGASQFFLGQLLVDRGKFQEGEEQLRAALENFDALLRIAADRMHWRVRRANIESELGRLYLSTERYPQGWAHLQSSIQTLIGLSSSDEGNVRWRRSLVRSLVISADFQSRFGRADLAREQLDAALDHIALLLEHEPTNNDSWALAIYADVCAARISAAIDPGSAPKSSQDALNKLDQHFSESFDPRILNLKATALAQVGRLDESESLQKHLRTLGFNGG